MNKESLSRLSILNGIMRFDFFSHVFWHFSGIF